MNRILRAAMPMPNPPHPGVIVKYECLEPLGLTIARAARGLGVSRAALSDLVNGRAGLSVDMALRLAQAFGSTPEPGWVCRPPMTCGRPGNRARAARLKSLPQGAERLGLKELPAGPEKSPLLPAAVPAAGGKVSRRRPFPVP